jgi:acyl-CoA thioesterase FadM
LTSCAQPGFSAAIPGGPTCAWLISCFVDNSRSNGVTATRLASCSTAASSSISIGAVGIPLVDAKARFLRPAKFNDVADIASEVTQFKRSSFEVTHRISIGGELAVEGSEIRVWAGRDPEDPAKLKGVPIPAAVIARFHAAA